MARSSAVIHWIGGPVLRARSHDEFHVGEAIEVGEKRLPGEVIRLKGDAFIAQVYEDTTGLRPGDVVAGAGGPLSVWLGPTLLGHIFDGLLRPLDSSAEPEFDFSPVVEQDQELAGGEIFGVVLSEGVAQKCLLPPHVSGVVESVALAGRYGSNAVLCHVRTVTDAIVEVGILPVMAGPHPPPGEGEAAGRRADDHRPTHSRHAVSSGPRRAGRSARRLRHW